MSQLITRKWVKGKLVSETKKTVNWKPNEADLDCVTVACECGNSFELPMDAMFGLNDMYCGQCSKKGKFEFLGGQ